MGTQQGTSLPTEENQHLLWVDLLRCIAICSVILVHVNESVYPISDLGFYAESTHTILFAATLQTIGRLGVPIFLFLTGYLLLDRKYDYQACVRFWKRNLLGIFITVEVWIVIYNLFRMIFFGEQFNGVVLLKDMLFVESMQNRIGSIWYMFVILGIYLFLPFIAMVLQRFEDKVFLFPMILVFGYLFVVPVISLCLGRYGQDLLHTQLSLDFSGGIYGYLVILGYFFKKGLFQKIKSGWLVLIGLICLVITVELQRVAYANDLSGIFNNNFYNCAFLVIAAACLFLLVSRIRRVPIPRILGTLAMSSFGVYLLHWPVYLILERYIPLYSRVGKIALVCVLTLGISWVVVWAVSKIPKVGRILFYARNGASKISAKKEPIS